MQTAEETKTSGREVAAIFSTSALASALASMFYVITSAGEPMLNRMSVIGANAVENTLFGYDAIAQLLQDYRDRYYGKLSAKFLGSFLLSAGAAAIAYFDEDADQSMKFFAGGVTLLGNLALNTYTAEDLYHLYIAIKHEHLEGVALHIKKLFLELGAWCGNDNAHRNLCICNDALKNLVHYRVFLSELRERQRALTFLPAYKLEALVGRTFPESWNDLGDSSSLPQPIFVLPYYASGVLSLTKKLLIQLPLTAMIMWATLVSYVAATEENVRHLFNCDMRYSTPTAFLLFTGLLVLNVAFTQKITDFAARTCHALSVYRQFPNDATVGPLGAVGALCVALPSLMISSFSGATVRGLERRHAENSYAKAIVFQPETALVTDYFTRFFNTVVVMLALAKLRDALLSRFPCEYEKKRADQTFLSLQKQLNRLLAEARHVGVKGYATILSRHSICRGAESHNDGADDTAAHLLEVVPDGANTPKNKGGGTFAS